MTDKDQPKNQPDVASTPAAHWRVKGEADPHGTDFDGERATLAHGSLTDDELANAIFMYDFRAPLDVEAIMAGKPSGMGLQTAAKERIRWLSRALVRAQKQLEDAQTNLATVLDDKVTAVTVSGAIPAGYALVPIQYEGKTGLTDAMIREFYDAWELHSRRGSYERLNAAYNAMVGAVVVAVDPPALPSMMYPDSLNVTPAVLKLIDRVVTEIASGQVDSIHVSGLAALRGADIPATWEAKDVTPAQSMQFDIPALVNRFLTWPMPSGFAADGCVTNPAYLYPRSGTNLLDAVNAEAMLRHVLAAPTSLEERPLTPDGLTTHEEYRRIHEAIKALTCTKIYSDKDRGYNKALGHVVERLPELLKNLRVPTPAQSAIGESVQRFLAEPIEGNTLTKRYELPKAMTKEASAFFTGLELNRHPAMALVTPEERSVILSLLSLAQDTPDEREKALDELEALPGNPEDRAYEKAILALSGLIATPVTPITPVTLATDENSGPTAEPSQTPIDASYVGTGDPTHQCTICKALWLKYQNEGEWFWSLRSKQCGTCCDSVHMGEQIISLAEKQPGWEYESVQKPRKSGDVYPPDGEGWEEDYSSGRPGQAWDRFDYHEETYWKRKIPNKG